MNLKISKIEIGNYTVREDIDQEHVNRLAQSLKKDGQWNPIIVRPKEEGRYEVISGHYRLRAAKKLGWKEIDAKVKDVENSAADVLSLKTNLVRKNMSEIEEAKVIKSLMDEHDLTQKEIADKLDRSSTWVSGRLSLALDVIDFVKEKIQEEEISPEHGVVISRLPEDKQKEFTKLVLEKDLTRDETREEIKRFKNDTIYTIGYQGKDFEEFLEILEDNEIEQVIDIRKSNESQYKPEFNGNILKERLEDNNISYTHKPRLGVDYLIQIPYKEGFIQDKCFENWYRWWVKEKIDLDLIEFADGIKDYGKTVLLCMEKHPRPKGDQKIYCHRDILATILQEKIDGNVLFPERVDL